MTTDDLLILSKSDTIAFLVQRYLKNIGYPHAQGTTKGGQSLDYIIRHTHPRILLVESCFYLSATSYMLGKLAQHYPKLYIAVFSLGEFQETLAAGIILRGVKSYIDIRLGFSGFRRGMRKILSGQDYIPQKISRIIDEMETLPPARLDSTAREKEVLWLMAEGKTIKEVAHILEISIRTVDHHKTHIYAKFNARNLTEALNAFRSIEKLDK
jgi:DNA-binding NarL/FixJ family response regulator